MLLVLFVLLTIVQGIGLFIEDGMIVSGIGALVIAVILAIALISARSESDYKDMLLTRKTLIQRLECEPGEEVYSDIAKFNKRLRKIKVDANSIFTNWVTNQKVASIDYIE